MQFPIGYLETPHKKTWSDILRNTFNTIFSLFLFFNVFSFSSKPRRTSEPFAILMSKVKMTVEGDLN